MRTEPLKPTKYSGRGPVAVAMLLTGVLILGARPTVAATEQATVVSIEKAYRVERPDKYGNWELAASWAYNAATHDATLDDAVRYTKMNPGYRLVRIWVETSIDQNSGASVVDTRKRQIFVNDSPKIAVRLPAEDWIALMRTLPPTPEVEKLRSAIPFD